LSPRTARRWNRRARDPMKGVVAIAVLLFTQIAGAQSLVGAWNSSEPLLESVKFTLTFSDTEYRVDCTLGETLGNYSIQGDKIYFTPTKIGIDAGSAGKNDTWSYELIDNDSFYMSSGPIKIKLFRIP
jgi:hypothetical protein